MKEALSHRASCPHLIFERQKRVTAREYAAFHMHDREFQEGDTACHSFMCKGGKLFEEWAIDQWCKVQAGQLLFQKLNQKEIRAEMYQGAADFYHNDHDHPPPSSWIHQVVVVVVVVVGSALVLLRPDFLLIEFLDGQLASLHFAPLIYRLFFEQPLTFAHEGMADRVPYLELTVVHVKGSILPGRHTFALISSINAVQNPETYYCNVICIEKLEKRQEQRSSAQIVCNLPEAFTSPPFDYFQI